MNIFPKLKFIAILVLVISFFAILNLTNFSKEIKNFFYLISSPIQKTFWKAGARASDFFEMIREIKNLKKENEDLKLKIQELLAENIAMKELKKENETLRGALEIGLEKDFKLILSQVIGKDISQDFILIKKGFGEGVSPGMPVVTQQKNLVGKVSEVYNNFSKVMLISNKEISFDAKLSNGVFGVVKGKGNLELELDLVPAEEEIKTGDLLVTAAKGGIFPGELLIGEIKEVKKSDLEPFQKAKISPSFDIKELESLFIITEF